MAERGHISKYREKSVTRDEVEALIAEGRHIVVVDGRVLKVDAWLPYHPGGDKAILHMVGRDATNEVRAFHATSTQLFMHKYQIGRIRGQWTDFVPPIQGGRFRSRTKLVTLDDGKVDMAINAQHSSSQDSFSSSSTSTETSPLFEPADAKESVVLRRRPSGSNASDSSATSLSGFELDEETLPSRKPADVHQQTQLEKSHDLEVFPSLDPETQSTIIDKYRQLDQRIRDEGLYNCNYFAYLAEVVRYFFLGLLSFYSLRRQRYALSGVFLGMLWHQLVFTVHDAGHMGITHSFHIDTCIGILIADFLGGLSCCWWKRNHNVHHIVTNSAEHDPDIQHMPFFAVSHRFFNNLTSSYYDRVMAYDSFAKFMLKYQHYLYYPVLTFGRFNLYNLSWQYIFLGQGPRKGPAWWHRYLEMIGQIFFWYWYGYLTVYKSIPTAWDRFVFILISNAITMPVHAQITLSHFAMSTADLGVAESFPQRMLRTTMDIDCPPWLDFFHGGLQFQAVHHLFPRIPRHNLRKCQKMVQEFCVDVGIPYTIYGFTEGNEKVINHLSEIAKQARILADCQRAMTAKDIFDGQ